VVVVEDEALDDEWDVSRRELDALLYGLARRRAGSEEAPATSRGRMEVPTQPFPRGADMTIEAAIASASTTFEVLKAAVSLRNQTQIDEALAKVRAELLEALDTGYSAKKALNELEFETQKLRTEKLELERQKQAAEAELERRASYDLVQPAPGRWAYVREGAATGSPDKTAYFCAACYADKREVPLQHQEPTPGTAHRLVCPVQSRHSLHFGDPLPPEPAPDPWY